MKGLFLCFVAIALAALNGFADSLPEIDEQPHFPPSELKLLPVIEKTTIEAYRKVGSHNPAWDKQAETALLIYARYITGQQAVYGTTNYPRMVNCISNALVAGCDDPLIQYAAVRLRPLKIFLQFPPELEIYESIISGLEKHPYPALRQCTIRTRAMQCLKILPHSTERTQLAKRWLESAARQLPGAIEDGGGRYEVYGLASQILEDYRILVGDPDPLFTSIQTTLKNRGTNEARIARSWHRR